MEYRKPTELKPHPISIELYGDNHIDDLKESIAKFGILVPLIITSKNIIISGHRRWRCAIELGIDTIPVEVKLFVDELEEKRSILEFNQQREKTTSQKIKEAKLLKDIIAEEARNRQKATRFGNHGDTNIGATDTKGETADIIGKATDIGGRTTFRKAERIYDQAHEGDEEARTWLNKLDTGEATVNRAYNELFDKAHVSHNAGENEWYTPKEYIELSKQVLGEIDLDPASTQEANVIIKAKEYFSKEQDGLKQEWRGRIWMNPPYAQPLVSQFCDKLISQISLGNVTEAIVLVNNATETQWFQSLTRNAIAICFPKGRVRFWSPDKEATPLQGQAILYFGDNCKAFLSVFKSLGFLARIYKNEQI